MHAYKYAVENLECTVRPSEGFSEETSWHNKAYTVTKIDTTVYKLIIGQLLLVKLRYIFSKQGKIVGQLGATISVMRRIMSLCSWTHRCVIKWNHRHYPSIWRLIVNWALKQITVKFESNHKKSFIRCLQIGSLCNTTGGFVIHP